VVSPSAQNSRRDVLRMHRPVTDCCTFCGLDCVICTRLVRCCRVMFRRMLSVCVTVSLESNFTSALTFKWWFFFWIINKGCVMSGLVEPIFLYGFDYQMKLLYDLSGVMVFTNFQHCKAALFIELT
jgi:hypothetical protein